MLSASRGFLAGLDFLVPKICVLDFYPHYQRQTGIPYQVLELVAL